MLENESGEAPLRGALKGEKRCEGCSVCTQLRRPEGEVFDVGVLVVLAVICVAGLIIVDSGQRRAILLQVGLLLGAVLPALLAWLQGRSASAAEGILASAALLGFAGQVFRLALRRSVGQKAYGADA